MKELYSKRLQREGGSEGNQAHYTKGEVQPIDLILSYNMSFQQGNVVKYVARYKDKNGLEDLKKAMTYLKMLIAEYEDEEEEVSGFDEMDKLFKEKAAKPKYPAFFTDLNNPAEIVDLEERHVYAC